MDSRCAGEVPAASGFGNGLSTSARKLLKAAVHLTNTSDETRKHLIDALPPNAQRMPRFRRGLTGKNRSKKDAFLFTERSLEQLAASLTDAELIERVCDDRREVTP